MIRKETYESRSILDADLMDGVKRLIDADLFIAKYREDIQRECPDEEVLSLHGELLDTLRKATQAFKQAICENLKIDSTDLDEKSSIILSEAVKSAQKLIHEELSGMKFTSWTMRSFSAIMLELKNIFEDVVNRWLKFYLKEFWIMIELGINEFSTMDQYVYWKLMTTLEKINPEIKYLRDLFADFIQGVSMKVIKKLTVDWHGNFAHRLRFQEESEQCIGALKQRSGGMPSNDPLRGQVRDYQT